MSYTCANITHEEMALDGHKICRFCRSNLPEPNTTKLKERQNEPTINDILEQYHQRFDDSRIWEIMEELEDMAYERAEFFTTFPEKIKCYDDLDQYWSPLDDMAVTIRDALQVFEDLKNDIQGLDECWNCKKMGLLKSKLTKSIPTENLYIMKLCANCYANNNKIIIANHKRMIDVDTEIPDDLTNTEKEMIQEFQNHCMQNTKK